MRCGCNSINNTCGDTHYAALVEGNLKIKIMTLTKICSQTNVAEVDNSAVECSEFISTDCIIHEAAISYLGLPENSSMTDVINALLLSLIDARNRILILETP